MSTFFSKWFPLCSTVARRVAPALRNYGWDADDAAQTVAAKLIVVGDNHRFNQMTDECLSRILPAYVRRTLFRLAGPKKNVVPRAEQQVLDLAESRGDEAAAEILTDVMYDAPPSIRDYLARALAGLPDPSDTREGRASRAARWLEGRLSA